MNKYEMDARYLDIGDLPSGGATYDFKRLFIRPFELRELGLLHQGMNSSVRPHQHIIRAVQMVCSADVGQLSDGDFVYTMAWLRRHSYPEFPIQASYVCQNMIWTDSRNVIQYPDDKKEALRKGFVYKPCGANNPKEIVRQNKVIVHTLEDDDLVIQHKEIDFPRVNTLTDFYELVEEQPHMKYVADLARWVRGGKTLKAKLLYLMAQKDMSLVDDIEEHKKKYFHGITERMRLVCSQCNNTMFHESHPTLLNFFADNSDKDLYNMSYNLMSQFGVAPDMGLPVKMFMYHHSTLVSDRRDAEQKAQQQRAMRGGTRLGNLGAPRGSR